MNAIDSPTRESDRIEEELRRKILNLELGPGMSISEASLIKQFGWGRTPLREAFQRLSEQSLLEIIPRHGVVIAGLSVFEFVEVMDAMAMVIGPAASLACRRLSENDLACLEDLVLQAEQAEAQEDFTRLAELDYTFHKTLADATGNRYLAAYLMHLHQIAMRFNAMAWKRDGGASFSLDEHRRIIEELRKRDPVDARAAMLAHVENARRRVMGPDNGFLITD